MQCISLPGPGTSAIQLEAFKKLLLALAIDPRNVARGTGSFHAPPSAVVASLPRHRRDGLATLARAYVDLVNALERFDSAAVLKSAAEHAALFERDGNAGLVHVVVADKMPLLQLLRLRRVYAAVPLAVVAKTLGVKVDGVVGAVFRTVRQACS